jgi:hypothetical protein
MDFCNTFPPKADLRSAYPVLAGSWFSPWSKLIARHIMASDATAPNVGHAILLVRE